MKKTLVLAIVVRMFLPGLAGAATHILTEAMGTGNVTPSSWYPAAVPGDTITIAADRVSSIRFRNFDGTPENPYIFTNPSDAKATLTTGTTNAIQFFESDNFKLLGNNCSSEIYGIEIDGSSGGIFGGVRIWCSSNWEVAYIHIHDTTGGISQNNNGEDGGAWACPCGAWTEANSIGDCRVHHNLIEDTNAIYAEGMYLGKTEVGNYPQWNTLEIDHNSVYRTGSDGIQAGQTSGWLKIHDNYIEEAGTQNDTGQNFGIISGFEAKNVEIYNNKIVRTAKTGINVHYSASGSISIHDNVIWNSGSLQSAPGIWVGGSLSSSIISNTIVGSTKNGISTPTGVTTGGILYNLLVANSWGGYNSDYTNIHDNRVQTNTSTEYFASAATGNFRLTTNSPARDAGVGGGYSTVGFDGNVRPHGSAPDIGAYEYYSPGELADLNDNGEVNLEDFAVLASYWMNDNICSEHDWCQGSDFDRSGTIDLLDLATFIESWLWQTN